MGQADALSVDGFRKLAACAVKQAEKEKKGTEKEIEAVRTKLKQIQSVNI